MEKRTENHDGDDVVRVMLLVMMLTTMPTMEMIPVTVGSDVYEL